MKALLASSLLLAAPFCARAAVSAPADPTAELDHEDSRASAAALQQRLQALRRSSPDVAAELSAFVQDQPADLKRKALAVGLRLTGELESLVALERRRAAL
ncbi:MAG TPA: hypothetical protein VNI01_00115, partial [Elusimicrobiota bacterium]|nr:hypothetical protein [Elusimicrobiota bacterium]